MQRLALWPLFATITAALAGTSDKKSESSNNLCAL